MFFHTITILPNNNLISREMAQKVNDIKGTCLQYSCKVPNISRLITNHERGLLKKTSFESQVTKIKVRQLKRSAEEFEIDPDISYCKFIRTSDTDCLIGVWQKNMDPASKHSSVYHLKFEYNQQHYNIDKYETCSIISDLSCSGPFFKRMDVTDSCERNMKDKSFLLYVGNTAVSGGRIVLNITDINTESSSSGLSEIIWRSPKCIWSCASNAYSERFAAGTENGCFVFDLLNFMEVENLQANILAVEFNKAGNLLYCGREKGELILYDLRQDAWGNISWHFDRTSFSGIKEMKLLSDETSMLICGTDGALWRVSIVYLNVYVLKS